MARTPFDTPEDAERAFYTAIEARDLAAMMSVWSPLAEIACIHPLGPRLDGPGAVREGWKRIFASGIALRFDIDETRRLSGPDLAVHLVYERIVVVGAREQPAQPVIATNVFRRRAGGWEMVLHHASPGGEPIRLQDGSGVQPGGERLH